MDPLIEAVKEHIAYKSEPFKAGLLDCLTGKSDDAKLAYKDHQRYEYNVGYSIGAQIYSPSWERDVSKGNDNG